jgi:chromosome segregation ATPase
MMNMVWVQQLGSLVQKGLENIEDLAKLIRETAEAAQKNKQTLTDEDPSSNQSIPGRLKEILGHLQNINKAQQGISATLGSNNGETFQSFLSKLLEGQRTISDSINRIKEVIGESQVLKSEIASLNSQLRAKGEELKTQLSEKGEEIEHLSGEIDNLNNEIKKKQEHINKQDEKLQKQKKRLDDIDALISLSFTQATKQAVDVFKTGPALKKAFGLNPDDHELKSSDDYVRYLINKSTDTLIKEVHKVILGQCKDQKRQIKDEEANLLDWMLKTRNLSFNADDKAHLITPELGIRFERSEMISTIEVMNGDVTKVYVPACPALKLKALVEVNHGQS